MRSRRARGGRGRPRSARAMRAVPRRSSSAVRVMWTRLSASSIQSTGTSWIRRPLCSASTRSSVSKNQPSSSIAGSRRRATSARTALNPHCASRTRGREHRAQDQVVGAGDDLALRRRAPPTTRARGGSRSRGRSGPTRAAPRPAGARRGRSRGRRPCRRPPSRPSSTTPSAARARDPSRSRWRAVTCGSSRASRTARDPGPVGRRVVDDGDPPREREPLREVGVEALDAAARAHAPRCGPGPRSPPPAVRGRAQRGRATGRCGVRAGGPACATPCGAPVRADPDDCKNGSRTCRAASIRRRRAGDRHLGPVGVGPVDRRVDVEHGGAVDPVVGEVRSAVAASSSRYGVVATRSGIVAARARNSSPSARVLAVTLRSSRSWNRWSLVVECGDVAQVDARDHRDAATVQRRQGRGHDLARGREQDRRIERLRRRVERVAAPTRRRARARVVRAPGGTGHDVHRAPPAIATWAARCADAPKP